MSANDFLEYARRTVRLRAVASTPATLFTTTERVLGVSIYNEDTDTVAVVNFTPVSDELDYGSYFQFSVPAGQSVYIPVKFFATDGLAVEVDEADAAVITVFVVRLSGSLHEDL